MPRHVAAPSMAVAIIPAMRHQRKSNGGEKRRHASKGDAAPWREAGAELLAPPRLEVFRSAKSR